MNAIFAVTQVQQSTSVLLLGIVVAMIALTGTIVSPLLVARYMNASRTKEREAEAKLHTQDRESTDRIRKDERLADFERTEAVREMAADAASLLKENNKIVAAVSERTELKLDTIHTLVNSSLTSALLGQMEALRELIAWKDKAGEPVGEASRRALLELEETLRDRRQAQSNVDTTLGYKERRVTELDRRIEEATPDDPQ